METGRPAHCEQLYMKIAEGKAPGCKLVRVAVTGSQSNHRVRISGDFFAYPEESIELLEKALCGLSFAMPDADIVRILEEIVASNGIELIGLDIATLVTLYKRCLNCGE